MKKTFLSITLLMTLVPNLVLAEGTIQLYYSGSTDNASIYTLEAQNISHPLVGISATLNLAPGFKFIKHEAGNFFETGNQDQVTYLVAPKKTKPEQVLIGIANLGNNTQLENGTIAKVFIAPSSDKGTAVKSITDTIASGIEQNKRIDYPTITWQITKTDLPHTGSELYFAGIISILIAACISIFHKITK